MIRTGERTLTERIDAVATHKIWAIPLFLGMMLLVFLVTREAEVAQCPVHDKGRAGHIPAVLQHGEEQKEQRDHGQERQNP